MTNLSVGTGLALLAASILGSTIILRLGPVDQAASAAPPINTAKAVAAAITAQNPPAATIVWYGTDTVTQSYLSQSWALSTIWRAWSDGKVEAMTTRRSTTGYNQSQFDLWCTAAGFCTTGWTVISSPAQGLTYRSDINFDQQVDGADLGVLLADWGSAPRYDIPPSDCPLNLINP